jgi:hypothetical protein
MCRCLTLGKKGEIVTYGSRASRSQCDLISPALVVTEFHERYLDRNGRPKGPSGRAIYTEDTMIADQCAQIVLKAARQHELTRRPALTRNPN